MGWITILDDFKVVDVKVAGSALSWALNSAACVKDVQTMART